MNHVVFSIMSNLKRDRGNNLHLRFDMIEKTTWFMVQG